MTTRERRWIFLTLIPMAIALESIENWFLRCPAAGLQRDRRCRECGDRGDGGSGP